MADKEKNELKNDSTKKTSDAEKKPVKEKVKLSVRIKKFLKDYKSELKKITWPTRSQVMKNTGIVIGAIIVVAALVGVLDLGFTKGIQLLGSVI